MPSGAARELDDQFFRAKRALVRSMEERDFFSRVGKRTVNAEYRFEDGIARFTVSQAERDMLNRQHYSNVLTRSRLP